ncbi:DEAD/DEAH box helicase [Jeotgalibacillus campisalis]|uniref:Non-specific serine/threonine protein kinase n=1 Tax=Jeotgalibacillus campisalis TaxID=220754 RepID=A0A0C2VPN9_9BACL|nr:DEAD/DEAH box helicase [Jeotgalibacillus campisalis]KIL50877.1 non-specific serine/threonine protein kinase [Jeotgalibacillus campisalis]
MNIRLSKKIIKENCGTVSFSRGEAFYRSNKVHIKGYSDTTCEAIVTAKEKFYVTINQNGNGYEASCSCPTLASYDKDCQHIAAVLIWMLEEQQKQVQAHSATHSGESFEPNELTEGFMTLFNGEVQRGSGHQRHFETRKEIDSHFILSPVAVKKGENLIAIEMKIEGTAVKDIRLFLHHVKEGMKLQISKTTVYDPAEHCFDLVTDGVILQLIEAFKNDAMYKDSFQEGGANEPHLLLIPPSVWDPLKSCLNKSPNVSLNYRQKTFNGLHLSDEKLPLQFVLTKSEEEVYQLTINGMHDIVLMPAYFAVIADGKWIELKEEDSKRLNDLKAMLDASKTSRIPVPPEQVDLFLEKVVPGLKKLGDVVLHGLPSGAFEKKPLAAKLYLDRVKDRLLAGIEFCYGEVTINPLEDQKRWTGSLLARDKEKEEEILQLMKESEMTETDSGYYLHNEALEYHFLHHVVPKMQGLVQLYATTAIRNRIFREHAPPKISVRIKKERTNWLEFKFEMEGFPEREIRALLSALEEKRKYYRLRNGSLFSLETKEIDEIRRFLNAAPIQAQELEQEFEMPLIKGLRLLDSVQADDFVKLEESFKQFLTQMEHPEQLTFELPDSLKHVLREYQKHGYNWLKLLAGYGFGGILADDMGLGKTLQSIAFIVSELPVMRKNNQQALIVCPSSVTYNWLKECMQFAPELEAVVLDGSAAERKEIQRESDRVDVLITSYPLLRKDVKWFEEKRFHTVFFDEAQAFKNPVTQTARAVKKVEADHRFALTGTPVENSIEELWSIFHVVFPELFQGLKEYSHLSRKTIARRVRPFLLRRMKEDVLEELPEKLELLESMELLPEQKKLYAAYLAKLRHDTLKHLDKDTLRKNRIKILAGLTRLRQICCHPTLFVDGYTGKSAKFEQLLQILEESRIAGRRVLVFSQFTKMLGLIGKELTIQGRSFYYLDGKTPSEERVDICQQFNQGERDLILVSLKAGGTGLNLTGADTVILYDTWWNPAVEEQAADRAHRMGQKKAVQVIKLIARGTIEEKMNELQEKKRHLIEELIDQNKNEPVSLTEEDIRDLLRV